ncbi:MAG: hypothetical protein HOJ45_04640 [Gemmatimonadetes bacterium]|nr:hypothetical protein [Gemmatimonadota bacterium]
MKSTDESVNLGRVLALCACGFNERARQALIALLPEPVAATVTAAFRQGDDLLTTATGPIEEALAAPWLVLREEGGSEADASSQEADPTSSDESTSETGDADVDAFFAESDTAIRAEAAVESAGKSGSKPAGSELAATLLARLLIGAVDGPAARVLTDLPLALQGEVLVLIASSTALSISRQLKVQERPALQALRDALGKGNESRDREQWGVDRACDVLRALDGTPPLRRALGATAAVSAEVVAVVQSHLFDFDDLTRLRDTELQALLGACSNANLARALIGAAEPVRDRILANVSGRRSALIGDETDLHAEATPDEIDLARREILARARILYENGTITTYFGSIQTEKQNIDDDVDAQEEDGEDDSTQEAEGDKQEVISGQPSILQRVIIIGVLSGILIMALVSIVGWLTSSPASPKRSSSRTQAGPQGRSSGRIAIAMETDPASKAAQTRQLVSGQTIQTPVGVEALLEFPSASGTTVVDVGEGSTVIGSDRQDRGQDKQGPASFYLRVEKVKVSVAGERFIVRTPVGQVFAPRGSVFRVRVVLNGTTQAHSVVGPLRVVVGDREWDLATGKGVSIDVDRSFEYFEPDRP